MIHERESIKIEDVVYVGGVFIFAVTNLVNKDPRF